MLQRGESIIRVPQGIYVVARLSSWLLYCLGNNLLPPSSPGLRANPNWLRTSSCILRLTSSTGEPVLSILSKSAVSGCCEGTGVLNNALFAKRRPFELLTTRYVCELDRNRPGRI